MKNKIKSLIPFFLIWAIPYCAFADSISSQWSALLTDYIHVGEKNGVQLSVLNYKAVKADKRWPVLLAALEKSKIPSGQLEAKAFWINAYNILAVKVVLEDYPVDSIKDAGGWITEVWDIDAGVVDGESRSLNYIEHEVLRKMGDPRIHAAIVCASVSCPDLRNEAFVVGRLDAQLSEQLTLFLSNPKKGASLSSNAKILNLSKLFNWFGEDFTTSGKSMIQALSPYMDPSMSKKLSSTTVIRYMDYDWSLNDSSSSKIGK